MTDHKPMERIYQKIRLAGFNPAFMKAMLPDWWDDELACTPSGQQYAALHLARIFSLAPESLRDEAEHVLFSFGSTHKYKHRVNVDEASLDVATAIAYSAAKIAVSNFKTAYDSSISLEWSDVRNSILADNPYVNLESLLRFCTKVGIPVIFISKFPSKANKMAGLALKVYDRPAIVLTQGRSHGYMLFDLAHELGHIAKGHLNEANGECLVDRKIEQNSTDHKELEANQFAFGVITGQEGIQFVHEQHGLNASQLATGALETARLRRIDPTHVALNYCFGLRRWSLASSTLKILCNGSPSDQEVVKRMMIEGIDLSEIDEDDLSMIKKLSGE